MLTTLNKPQFLSRIFTDTTGRQFRLTFFVAIIDGHLRGHLISAQPVSSSTPLLSGSVGEPFCLPIICNEKKPDTPYTSNFVPIVSPYFSLEFLINSQPTRAPAFVC